MYLIWTIINYAFIIVFFASILAFITKGKKLFQNKFGILLVTVLFIGFVGIIGDKEDASKNEYVLPVNDKPVGRIAKQKTAYDKFYKF